MVNTTRRKANLPEWPAPGTSSAPAPATQELATSTPQSINMVDDTTIHDIFSILSDLSVSASIPKEVSPEFHDSFILDSGATTHVCNDFSCFQDFTPHRQWLTHGDTGMWIDGYSSIILSMVTLNGWGQNTILLGHIVYCPKFHLNIVSFPHFHDRKLFWNTEFGLLYHTGKNIAWVKKWGNLFIVGKGKQVSQSINTIKHSSKPLVSEAPGNIWHHQLGHIYYSSIAKLPQMVDGIAIKGKPNHSPCEVCELAKAKSQISHHPAQHARQPGECVHLDLIDNMVAYNGNRYACHFLDDTTHLHMLYTLNSHKQDEVMLVIWAFVHLMKT